MTRIYVITDNQKIRKPLKWLGNSKRSIQEFPFSVQKKIGDELARIQNNKQPGDWKPVGTIGPGVIELRIHHAGEFRVIYVSKFPEAIYVLSAFQKKTEKITRKEIVRARKIYAEIKQGQIQR